MVDGDAGGLGRPRSRVSEQQRQAVLDAAAVLQVRRSETAAAIAAGDTRRGEIVARGLDRINEWMLEAVHTWRENLSVRPAAIVRQLRLSLPVNRRWLEGGGRMISLCDHDGTEPGARWLLAGEDEPCYRLGAGPVQMKIIDRRFVLLQGPFIDEQDTLMAVTADDCLDAAWRYWHAALASSFPATDIVAGLSGELRRLTPRQQQVVALMAADTRDEAIAAALEVSVRTVRAEIARVMSLLGVRSRFAAGVRVRELVQGPGP